MDPVRVGLHLRRLGIRLGLRQVDVAARLGSSARTVARIEHGELDGVRVRDVERLARALGASLEVAVRWHGGDLERVMNARHSAMHEAMARWFRALDGWTAVPEVSFSVFGERGVVAIVAWHARTATLLVVELKTEIVDVGGLLGQVDRYRRLAPGIARGRGWDPKRVAVWVVLAPGRTNARRLSAYAATIRSALPDDGRGVSGWLADPTRPLAALSFLPERLMLPLGRAQTTRRRVDRSSSPPERGRNASRPTTQTRYRLSRAVGTRTNGARSRNGRIGPARDGRANRASAETATGVRIVDP